MNIENLNQQSKIFKNKLDEMKKQCYEEMNKRYSKILQEKIKEIHKTILEDAQKQNQIILNSYAKKFEELENKREKDYQMSKVNINNDQGDMSFSLVKTTHHGIKCNKCGKEPIIGYRYKCTVCNNFNLCDECESQNSETEEHKHNFIKMRNEEKIKEKEKEQKPNINIPNKVEKKIEYNYELVSKEKNDLNKKITEFGDKKIKFNIIIKNNCNSEWPGNGRTLLINDQSSDIKYNNIVLNNLKFGQSQQIPIILHLKNLRAGLKKCIFHFSIDGQLYGDPLILNINVEEDERVTNLRNEYLLSQEEYDSEKLWKALQKTNFDMNKAFESLFDN